ncbi:MAG TPA: PQQ-dependent sugar dehydrogenase [Vicinamibacterales bacterium]|nr:PQQ-dependent sugar dehydrogenase [Vicinamibacterales bacterium]
MNAFKLALILIFAGVSLSAQQNVPFRNNIPVAPQGLTIPPLPDKPVEFHTAEGQDIRVVVLARGIPHPWSLAFLPDGSMLVTERGGRLRVIRKGVLDPQPVAGVPAVRAQGLSGLMDVVLHPAFAQNQLVYLSYTKPVGTDGSTLAVARGRWTGTALADVKDIFVAGPGAGGASRLAFARDGSLFMTTGGGGGNGAQDPNSDAGKVLRLRDDGSVPPDNPFVGRAGYKPEVYTLGHRNSIGLAMHPGTGEMWQNENGPNGGDEVNILKPGRNYGWPLVSFGRTYPGPWQNGKMPTHEGFEPPVVFWVPSIAVSGMAFYTGDRLPKWKGDVFVGSMRTGEIPGTGHLERILFNTNMEELRRESLLVDLHQRIRDVRQGPDQLLYLLTEAEDGAVLRIEPTAPQTAAR